MSLPPDYHLHTVYCGHASGSVEEMVRAAIQKGFTEIGFAEHFPYPDGFEIDVPDLVVRSELWPAYLADVEGVRHRFGDRIRVRLGVEIDYLQGRESFTAAKLGEQAYDVIFGSVHLLDGLVIDYDRNYLDARLEAFGGLRGLWRCYWDRLEALIHSDLCDVFSHLDLPKKFGLGFPALVDWERVDDLLSQIRDRNLTIELNTGGIDRTVMREPYPTERILRMAFEKGIDVLLGSDAHRPDQIGRHFREGLERLTAIGWRYMALFEARRKTYLPIAGL